MAPKHKYLISVVGPTAVGKTAVAIQLAKHYHTEIISSDSRQFYKEISIGTAKPSEEELKEITHHFVGQLSIEQTYSAGDFERDALMKLDELFTSHDTVVMVGGSGLYIKALTDGLDNMPVGNEPLREELHQLFEEKGIEALQEKLRQASEKIYSKTELQNPQRVMRAIEIALTEKQAPKEKTPRDFKVIKIGLNLPRELLYDRINKRVDVMMKNGLLDEIKSVLPHKDTYALQTVGYKELFEYLEGVHSLEKAVDLIRQHSRNYAKRQLTWFRRETDITWFEPDDIGAIIEHINLKIKDGF